MFLALKGLFGVACQFVDFRLEFIYICCVGQFVGLLNGIAIAFVSSTLADNGIVVVGGAEVLAQFFAQSHVLGEGFVHQFPVAHGEGHNDFETYSIAVFIAGSIALDDFYGKVQVFHGLLGLGVHLDVRQVHVERDQVGGL